MRVASKAAMLACCPAGPNIFSLLLAPLAFVSGNAFTNTTRLNFRHPHGEEEYTRRKRRSARALSTPSRLPPPLCPPQLAPTFSHLLFLTTRLCMAVSSRPSSFATSSRVFPLRSKRRSKFGLEGPDRRRQSTCVCEARGPAATAVAPVDDDDGAGDAGTRRRAANDMALSRRTKAAQGADGNDVRQGTW